MNSQMLDKIDASTAAEIGIDLTQQVVRIDSANGEADVLARDLENGRRRRDITAAADYRAQARKKTPVPAQAGSRALL